MILGIVASLAATGGGPPPPAPGVFPETEEDWFGITLVRELAALPHVDLTDAAWHQITYV